MKKFAAIALALILAMSTMFATVASAAGTTFGNLSFEGFKIVDPDVVVDVENMLIYGLDTAIPTADLGKYLEKGDNVKEMIVPDEKYLGTGSQIILIDNDDVPYVFEIVIFGDVTGDSVSDVLDAAMVNRFANDHAKPSKAEVIAVDTNYDGAVTEAEYQEQINVLADSTKDFDQKKNGTNEDVITEVEDQVVTTKGENPVIEDKDVSVTFNNGVISDEHYYVDDYIYASNKDGETVCYAVVKGKGLFAGQVMIEVEFVTLLEKIVATVNDVLDDSNLSNIVTVKNVKNGDVADITVEVNATEAVSGNFDVNMAALNGLLTEIDEFKADNLQTATLTVGDYAIATNGDFDRSAIKALVFDIASGIFCSIANAEDNVVKSYSGNLVTNEGIPAEAFNVDVVMTGNGKDIDKVKAFAAKIARYVAFDVVDGNAVVDITMPAGFATTVVDVIGDGDVDKATEVFNSMTVEDALLAFSMVDPETMSSSSANAIKKLISIACGLDTAANKVLSEVKTATVTDANGKVIDLLNGKIFDVLGESNLENLVGAVLSVLSDEALNANIANFVNGDIYTAEFDVAIDYRNISEKVIVNFDFFGNAEAPDVIEKTSTYFNSIIADLGIANVANVAYSADTKNAVVSLDASAFINNEFAFNEDALNGLYTNIKGYFDDNYGTSTILVGDFEIVTNGKIKRTTLKNFLFDVAKGFFLDVADLGADNVVRNFSVKVTEADGSSVDFDMDFVLEGTPAHIAKIKNIAAKVAECISFTTVNGNAVVNVTLPAGFQNTVVEALSKDGTVESAIAEFNKLTVGDAFNALTLIDAETISTSHASDIERIILTVADYSSVINKLLGKVTSAKAYDLKGNAYELLNGSDFDGSKIVAGSNVFAEAVKAIYAMLDEETTGAYVSAFTTGDGVYTVEFDVAVSIGGISEKVIVNFDMFGLK